ncbi:hypothetical protein [Aestuariispira insulae]|uniref:Uncharacterized protein n=1 Tax=Aestuariispira insulae TaxID=1461337 RepID=A0A3D9HI69_9PROT|nr:hypothetical protein [Aestuariispira insulae]RED49219.1 hypothetical protein DFP90_106197 [Aestuariispira insulae]
MKLNAFGRAVSALALVLAAGCQSAQDQQDIVADVSTETRTVTVHSADPDDITRLKKQYEGLSAGDRAVLTHLLQGKSNQAMILKDGPSHGFWQALDQFGLALKEKTGNSLVDVGQTYSLNKAAFDALAQISGVPADQLAVSAYDTPCGRANCYYAEMACGDVFDSAKGVFSLPKKDYQRLYLYAMGYFLATTDKRQIPGQSMGTNMVLLARQCAITPDISLVEALRKTALVAETTGPDRRKPLWPQKTCAQVFRAGEPAYQGKASEMPYLIEMVLGYYSAYAGKETEKAVALAANNQVLPALVNQCLATPKMNFGKAVEATSPF